MSLIECSECSGQVSTLAETCPHCGVQIRGRTCPECGNLIEKAGEPCPNCGFRASALKSAAAPVSGETESWFKRFFRGDVALWKTFWLGFALANTLIAAAIARIRNESDSEAAFILLAWVWFTTWWWFSWVAVWRSAKQYRKQGNTPGWGVAAQVIVVVNVLWVALSSALGIVVAIANFQP